MSLVVLHHRLQLASWSEAPSLQGSSTLGLPLRLLLLCHCLLLLERRLSLDLLLPHRLRLLLLPLQPCPLLFLF